MWLQQRVRHHRGEEHHDQLYRDGHEDDVRPGGRHHVQR